MLLFYYEYINLNFYAGTAGNDHRLGAQEAPPAIMSLYTGKTMEKHLKSVIDGGALAGYNAIQQIIDVGSSAVQGIPANAEDRNRTAPFPFCGNRFEFRAVGSNQNVAWPLTVLNSMMAQAMAELSESIEGGMSVRDATAAMLKQSWSAVFNGNGYSTGKIRSALFFFNIYPFLLPPRCTIISVFISLCIFTHTLTQTPTHIPLPCLLFLYAVVFSHLLSPHSLLTQLIPEWHEEAERRGLKNLPNTPAALANFGGPKDVELFSSQDVFGADEVAARRSILMEEYTATMHIEANCLLDMVNTGILPALAADLKDYEHAPALAGSRRAAYLLVAQEVEKLADTIVVAGSFAEEEEEKAALFCGKELRDRMESVREACDAAERLCATKNWPYPSYQDLLFSHQTEVSRC